MKKILLLFMLFAVCCWGYAQPAHLSVDNLTTDNGLPSNWVNSILQDGLGYMWFATYRGVVRYDGYNMHTYNLRSTVQGWYNESVDELFKDNRGNIWAGQNPGGVLRYDRATDRFIRYVHNSNDKNSLPYNNIMQICRGRQNEVWVVTTTELINRKSIALSRFEPKTGNFTN